jgi:LuxR family maltose regulon positive regulatory protein
VLIASKIAMPILRQQLLPRPRLVERLRAGAAGKLTLVSAPGGFGKTSVVCQWLQQEQIPVAWYSIDEGDAAQGRFFQYVLASLAATAGDLQEAFDPLMQGETELLPMEVIGKIIVAMQHHSERLVLVLDDYQMVGSGEIHDSITFLLRYMPASLHLVIVSRQEPPIALAKFRAMGEVSELHAHSLKFSQEESSTILRGAATAPLDEWQDL